MFYWFFVAVLSSSRFYLFLPLTGGEAKRYWARAHHGASFTEFLLGFLEKNGGKSTLHSKNKHNYIHQRK